jgi:NAD(P)-dependent dehydrogenase (short-subunit alcohol dehydrogenase family)
MTAPLRIVLTGATRGLGLAMTEKFIELGHTVLGCGQNRERIEELRRRFGPPHDFAEVWVNHEMQVAGWSERLLGSHGPPDLLLNNAAVLNAKSPLWELSPGEFDRVIEVNVKGVAFVLRHWLPEMVARKKGVIVNFSSQLGRTTMPQVAPYCASKWAVEGLTRALAQELPEGMAAIPLDPGIIDTDMLRSFFGEAAGKYPDARAWAERAVPFLLQLGPADNGKPLSVPC